MSPHANGELSHRAYTTQLYILHAVMQNDPWGAARYYAEAEKQEELAESAAAEIKVCSEQQLPHLMLTV